MSNKVFILNIGYSHPDSENPQCMRANCTSTLIQTNGGLNIIVDTMTAWDGQLLQEALAQYNLQPKDINYVICTHGHTDHTGCNYLFTNAVRHFVGSCVSRHDRFLDWDTQNPYKLENDDVIVIPTPGHTLSCVSVVIRNTNLGRTVGVCGDLFERQDDVWDENIWLEAGSEDSMKQMANRLKMIEMCSFIIPGHGDGFQVTNEMKQKLKQNFLQKHGIDINPE